VITIDHYGRRRHASVDEVMGWVPPPPKPKKVPEEEDPDLKRALAARLDTRWCDLFEKK
jgi:hypothetical protein